jgi:hypothetical protein
MSGWLKVQLAAMVIVCCACAALSVCCDPCRRRTLEGFESRKSVRVGLATLVRSPKDLPHWLDHHRGNGVTAFLIRLEDSSHWQPFLASQSDVVHLEVAESDAHHSNYHALMDRQKRFVNKMLHDVAGKHGIDWVLHLDQDELLSGSAADVLADLPPSIKAVHMENVEAVYDADTRSTNCFEAARFARCSKGARCRSYVNGKGGGRPVPGVSFAGPHNFSVDGRVGGEGTRELPYEKLHVQHFDSCTLGVFVDKFWHISRNVRQDDIPFADYPRNMQVARMAHDAYAKTTCNSVPT